MGKFCIYCGKPLLDDSKFCIACGNPQISKKRVLDDFAPRDQIENKEKIMYYGAAWWLGGIIKMEGGGHAYLTNKRFIYACNGALPGRRSIDLQEGKFEVDIPYSNIKKILKLKEYFFEILMIETKDGLKYKIGVFNRERWFDMIAKSMSQNVPEVNF